MIPITEQQISREATNTNVMKRGQSYYFQNRVLDFKYNPKDLIVSGKVRGSSIYKTELHFDKLGNLSEYHCNCQAYKTYEGACKHIVALLYKAKDYFTSQELRKKRIKHKNNIAAKNVIQLFSNNFEQNEKEEVKLDIIVHLDSTYIPYKYSCKLELKMGTNRMYLVKSMKEFFNNLKEKCVHQFGKNFTYDNRVNYFNEENKKVIELIRELYEAESLIEDQGYFKVPNSIFKYKLIELPDQHIKKLFKLLENRKFTLNINDFNSQGTILHDRLPLNFKLNQTDSHLVLENSNSDMPILITTYGEYVFYKGSIYKTSKEELNYVLPLLSELYDNNGTIYFDNETKDEFVSEVLPFTEKLNNIDIDNNLKQNFYRQPLEAQIFLDKYIEGISAEVTFLYGEYKFYPFRPYKQSQNDKKIIIRDNQKEKEILLLFEKAHFKVTKNNIYLNNDEAIFEFIYHILPQLQNKAEVFYTEEFKNIKISNFNNFSSSVKINNGDMLEVSFDSEDIDTDELKDIIHALKEKRKFIKLKKGSYLPIDDDVLKIADIFNYMQLDENDLDDKRIILPKYRSLYLDQKLQETGINNIEYSNDYRGILDNLNNSTEIDYNVPNELNSILRSYQVTGFKWFKALSQFGFGGILADDMGLGKTLQTIAFIKSENKNSNKPSLVIAPTSLVYNWADEIKKFTPDFKYIILNGPKLVREELFKQINDADIVITSYALIRRDIEYYKDYYFDYCFIDEAQHIKNPNSLSAKAVKQVKAKAYYALTGTPIENSLIELWSIFDFILPGYLLSHKDFVDKYEKPIMKEQDQKSMDELKKQIRPFILRRMKKDVLKELPEKIESKISVELTKEQKKVYLAYLQEAKGYINQEISTNGFNKSHIKIIAALTRLRQICCHPDLFIENYKGESGKMIVLTELIEELIQSGHRILLFSQFTSMLKIIEKELVKSKINYYYLDGSTKAEDRQEYVRQFNKGQKEMFLISLKAGGTGLNLTGADTVIHFDPWWNPAVEEQATDRVYRIGQDRVVQVFKLITQGTIEEKIFNLQIKKKDLINQVIKPGETLLNKMTQEDIYELFS